MCSWKSPRYTDEAVIAARSMSDTMQSTDFEVPIFYPMYFISFYGLTLTRIGITCGSSSSAQVCTPSNLILCSKSSGS